MCIRDSFMMYLVFRYILFLIGIYICSVKATYSRSELPNQWQWNPLSWETQLIRLGRFRFVIRGQMTFLIVFFVENKSTVLVWNTKYLELLLRIEYILKILPKCPLYSWLSIVNVLETFTFPSFWVEQSLIIHLTTVITFSLLHILTNIFLNYIKFT